METTQYAYEDFMKYKDINAVIPSVLYKNAGLGKPNIINLDIYDEILNEIITSVKQGNDPNEIILKNNIKHLINVINQLNYDETLEKLQKINFSSIKIIRFFISELIICAMRYQISIKGYDFEDTTHKTIPEICADVQKHFMTFIVPTETNPNNFHIEILNTCQQYFLEFLNLNKSIDENNVDTSDYYKGFMTVLGLLFERNVISIKIVGNCIEQIIRNIFCINTKLEKKYEEHDCYECSKKMFGYTITSKSKIEQICFYDCEYLDKYKDSTEDLVIKRTQTECINLYKGYEHLINHVLHYYEKKVDEIKIGIEQYLILLNRNVKLTNSYELKQDSQPIIEYIIGKSIDMIIPDSCDKTIITKFDNYIKLFDDKKEALKMIKTIIINDTNLFNEQIKILNSNLLKIENIMKSIIEFHTIILNNNKLFKAVNKKQLVEPLKKHIMITHKNIGTQINKLCLKISSDFDKKYEHK
jgi:hypothetical protein